MSSLITITGASGFIGFHLTKFYLEKNYSVHALIGPDQNVDDFKSRFNQTNNLEVTSVDIKDLNQLNHTIQSSEIIIHLAGIANFGVNPVTLYEEVNVNGTKNIIEVCQKKSVKKLIHISSSETIYRGRDQKIGNEKKLFQLEDLKGPYSKSKLKAENQVKDYIKNGGCGIIIHPTTPIGSNDLTPTPPGELILMYLHQKLTAYYNAGVNFIGVSDLVQGIDLAINRGKIGENYILGGENLYLKDLFKLLEKISKVKAPTTKIPYLLAYSSAGIIEKTAKLQKKKPIATIEGVASVKYPFFFSSEKAKNELGFNPNNLEHDLKEAIDFFREE